MDEKQKGTLMKWISFFLATSFLFVNSAFSVYKPKVIYGEDNRLDLYKVEEAAVKAVARSTAAMFALSALTKTGNVFKITSQKFGEGFNLCPSEPFFDQPSGAMCSAFLVAPDMVATAGHCISSNDCVNRAFGFGYAMRSEKDAPEQLPEEDVYFCKAVVKREVTTKQDYSLVQLDRPVRGYDVLKMSSQDAKVNDSLMVVGHPSGIPTKVAGGAKVRTQEEGFFVANLDTYGGNSGSAVFNAETLEVMGILVRGERDFSYDSGKKCYRSNVCNDAYCRGEDSTNISFIEKALNTTYLE
jgi:hypothetical protein